MALILCTAIVEDEKHLFEAKPPMNCGPMVLITENRLLHIIWDLRRNAGLRTLNYRMYSISIVFFNDNNNLTIFNKRVAAYMWKEFTDETRKNSYSLLVNYIYQPTVNSPQRLIIIMAGIFWNIIRRL